MGYRNLQACVTDLQRHGKMLVVHEPISAELEAAEIQRRVYLNGGPAILFENVIGCQFPMVSNLFGNIDQARFLFRDSLEAVRRAIELKIEPANFFRRPTRYWRAPWTALAMRPKLKRTGPVIANQTQLDKLPQLKSWPDDGGAFITLPQVYSEDVTQPGMTHSNLGMYRIQLSGNDYLRNREIGLHYQIHRGIGVHQQRAIAEGKPFRVNIFVGGSPAMTLAAVMPLPEGLSELTFAGALAGHRIPMVRRRDSLPIYGEADFCISGIVQRDALKKEGPFGDHLGYYSLQHDFPVLTVDKVYHRQGAIWPFTVVGRPPQEDSTFGQLIHELTDPIIPTVIPGVQGVHAVDASGVHPLLLAVGSERYVPYRRSDEPQELLTQANAILGQGQMSLAKYLLIADGQDEPAPHLHHEEGFFHHVLKRVDWTRDIHFQTRTTIDTLDYSGSGFNQGSKVVIAARGAVKRELPIKFDHIRLPDHFHNPRLCTPGIIAVNGPKFGDKQSAVAQIEAFCRFMADVPAIDVFPLIVIVDDSGFVSESFRNFLWVVFTRSNPAADIHGVRASLIDKHWGCAGPLVIDARIKPHHAPPLIEDKQVTSKIDALASRGGELAKYL
jgi:4-hydroxy-3-polyprenylbenzoate decarboxylase